jgi:phosphatidylethanolamine/phosphatidyl-N-methylethanolamine N-methyltransferase
MSQISRNPLLFWRQYLRNPMSVGAVAPSGEMLARAMVQNLSPRPGETVVELGPGTGVFTQRLIAHGVREEDLILVELNEQFAHHLRRRHPKARVIQKSATDLLDVLRDLGHGPVNRMISGLPFRSLPAELGSQIARAIGASLRLGGTLVQFSYFPVPPLPVADCEQVGLNGKRVAFVLSNIPPAAVWHYTKRSQ